MAGTGASNWWPLGEKLEKAFRDLRLLRSSPSSLSLFLPSSPSLFSYPSLSFLILPTSSSSSLTSRDSSLFLPLRLRESSLSSPPLLSPPHYRISSFPSRSRTIYVVLSEWKLGTLINNFVNPKVATRAPRVQWKLKCILFGGDTPDLTKLCDKFEKRTVDVTKRTVN